MNREQQSAAAKDGKWAAARAKLPQGNIPPGAAGIGRRILIARVLRKMSQHDLAKAVGVSPQSVINWEAGKSHPSVAQVEKIAATFGDVRPGVLVKWQGGIFCDCDNG